MKHLRFVLAATLTLALAGSAQQTGSAQPAPDPAEVLQRTGERLLADLQRMPRYTCVQSITRTYYAPKQQFPRPSCSSLIAAHDTRKKRLPSQGWDRLRLEVALVEGNSVYSWVGAPRFTDDTLDKLAGFGPLGSGDFGVFLSGILLHTTLVFQGGQVVDGRRVFEYSYEMPIGQSTYKVKVPEGWEVTGYSGTVLLDPEASDLVRLVVRTGELPPESTACRAITEVTYGRTSIHNVMVLVPRATRLDAINVSGHESTSQTSYANCREYASTARMIFDGTTASAGPVTRAAAEPPAPLPAGLRFNVHITTPVETDTAAAGDPIEAVLTAPMHDKNKEVIAPAGARLHGRLRTVKWWTEPSELLQITVQFESVEIGDRKIPLSAVLYRPRPAMVMGNRIIFTKPDDPSVGGAFFFQELRLHPKQLDSEWITTAPDAGKDKK
ncbi:MAG: hypothetical protein LAP21_24585 [Acidobacteriia bacterium]|nr:hypothetical protein [Terriglobia bacterium]